MQPARARLLAFVTLASLPFATLAFAQTPKPLDGSVAASPTRPPVPPASTAPSAPPAPSASPPSKGLGTVPPKPVILGPITQITAGGDHTCASFGGRIKCWGSNSFGELGLGTTDARGDGPNELGAALPLVDLGQNASAVVDVAAGSTTNCALFADGSVKCWGARFHGVPAGNAPGQLGANLAPVNLGGRSAKRIFVGPTMACALLDGVDLKCWGTGELGLALGNAIPAGQNAAPIAAPIDIGPGRAIAATPAAHHNCALIDDGSVGCWGPIYMGPAPWGIPPAGTAPGTMGANLTRLRFIDQVEGGTVTRRIVAASLTGNEPLALLDDGTARAWFRPGATGNVYGGFRWRLPGRATAIGAGVSLFCALVDDGSVFCSTTARTTTPVAVVLPAGRTATAIAVGRAHACALLDDRSVACWGDNSAGQLGQGDTQARTAATVVALQ